VRTFKYTGKPVMTRGEYGVRISGGHEDPANQGWISVFDPDFGDMIWAFIGSKNWEETTEEELTR